MRKVRSLERFAIEKIYCLIAKSIRIIMRINFAGSFAKKALFSRSAGIGVCSRILHVWLQFYCKTALCIALPMVFCFSNPLCALAAQEVKPAENAAPASQPVTGDNKTSESKNETEGQEQDTGQQEELGAWEIMWTGQREMINEIREKALQLSDSFAQQTENLSRHMQPFEEEGRRLLVFANTFKDYPNALEAVGRRISVTIAEINGVLEPVNLSRTEAQSLLERVNYMASSLPDDADQSKFSPEMQEYLNDIIRARLRLTAVLAQYNSLLPSLGLLKRLEDAKKVIYAQLPELWKNYYLQKPVAWLTPSSWSNLSQALFYSRQALMLRLPVELPSTASQWSTALLRFFIGLIFVSVLSLLLKKHWLKRDSSFASRHIFKAGIPFLAAGFALLGSAMSSSGDFFRYILAIACFCIIIGEIHLAWDLRLIQFPKQPPEKSPFLGLLPLTLCIYALFYLPLTQPLILVIWAIILVISLLRLRNRNNAHKELPPLESGALDCHSIILWLCLFLVVSGFHIYSMILYLAYVSFSLGMELSVSGMNIVGSINEHLPHEGARAALARLLVALAAPFVLVLAVIGLCLWIAILPGGTYLLGEYALKGVSVGATQFNIIQVLLIISVFYLTRTVVAMGTRFLTKLPQQGLNFDATLITPMQTALTYAAWAVFGLFVLRSLGMELSNLAMVAGGLSVGIGFGMQTIVNNFLSGLILIFGRNLQVGDIVEVGGTTGRVRKISVRATMVETYDNAVIYVPNSEFMSGRLINWTSFSRSMRKEVQVGVAYGSDTATVIKLLLAIAKEHENVLKYPAPTVSFADFAASSLDFRLRFWVNDYDLAASTASDIRLAIDRVFNENHIEIAFPQMDIHLKDMPEQAYGPSNFRASRPRLAGNPPAAPGRASAQARRRPRRPGLASHKNRI